MKENNNNNNNRIPIDIDNPGIIRIEEKCINCGQCRKTCFEKVGIHYDYEICHNTACVNCGQCIINCPVGAIVPRYVYHKVKNEIQNPRKIVVALTSPAVRVALGDEFGFEIGSNIEGKMVSCLRKLGFDFVFDTTFGADLTVMEEASEFIDRIKNDKKLPQFTSCCPSWVKYCEIYHPDLRSNLSTCKSPISMQNSMIKSFFAEKKGINKEDIVTVAITPCTAKKAEIKRNEIDDGDYVLTTSELAIYLKEESINLNDLNDSCFDEIFGRGSESGVIFGRSAGVSESVVRTVYYMLTNSNLDDSKLVFTNVLDNEYIKESSIKINDYIINILVIQGLTNFELMMDSINKYHIVEVMNCPGGCIGGGGQPLGILSKQKEIRKNRAESLNKCDKISVARNSYDNEDVKYIYKEFLGKTLSDRCCDLLHTSYDDKSNLKDIGGLNDGL